jgi:hypothetical protein
VRDERVIFVFVFGLISEGLFIGLVLIGLIFDCGFLLIGNFSREKCREVVNFRRKIIKTG